LRCTKSIPILGYRKRKTKITLQGSIESFIADSVRSKICSPCNEACHILGETLVYPYILHLTYPTRDANGHLDIPDFLEKEITIDGTCYDIVGAVYGDGYHFLFRYHHDGKVYEADGMAEHPTSNHHRKIRAALSKEIHGPYESSLAGHISWKFNAKKIKVDGKKIVDVYYTKR
jgi:hypothetical protein